MKEKSQEIAQLIEDFQYLKKAVLQTNRIFRFLTPKVLRLVYLAAGLGILIFAGWFYLLIQQYGAYNQIPGNLKSLYFGGIVIFTIWSGTIKVKSILKRIKELGLVLNLGQVFKEVYTWNTLITGIPFLVTIGLTVVFLTSQGLNNYLVPCLAILYGLLLFAMINFLDLKELVIGAAWILLSGFGTLFMKTAPLQALCLTFGLGFIVMFIASFITGKQE